MRSGRRFRRSLHGLRSWRRSWACHRRRRTIPACRRRKGKKPNRPEKPKRQGPRKGSLGRNGGGRALSADPDEMVVAKPARCGHCQAAFRDADQTLDARYDKIDLPTVRPVVTRVERYAGRCRCCGATTLAAVPEGLEPGTPFSLNIVALAMYLRFVHAVSYQRSEPADAGPVRAVDQRRRAGCRVPPRQAALRLPMSPLSSRGCDAPAWSARTRPACASTGTTCWNWVFQNADVVIHVVRRSRGADVVAEVLDGHRPALWVSDLYGAQQGHAEHWQVCLAHQLRDCQYAIDAGDAVFAPRMKALLLRAVVLARRHRDLAESTRRQYRRRLDRDLDAIMALAPSQPRRPAIAQAIRQGARSPVHLSRSSRTRRRQQQQRTGTPAHRDLSKSHRRLPLRLGCRSVRRRPLRHRHRRSPRQRRLSGDPR